MLYKEPQGQKTDFYGSVRGNVLIKLVKETFDNLVNC